jgi:hypothetical protein
MILSKYSPYKNTLPVTVKKQHVFFGPQKAVYVANFNFQA